MKSIQAEETLGPKFSVQINREIMEHLKCEPRFLGAEPYQNKPGETVGTKRLGPNLSSLMLPDFSLHDSDVTLNR